MNLARLNSRDFDSVLLLFMQERLLYRLSVSRFRKMFVLKGGLFLFSFDGLLSRPTKDVDFLAQRLPCDEDRLLQIFREVTAISGDDGVAFDTDSLVAEAIREGTDYHGLRIRVTGTLGSAQKTLQIDVGFGDIVVPKPCSIEFPVLLADCPAPTIAAYSTESVIAEKFEAMLKLSILNSRMKDFFDIDHLSRKLVFDGRLLQEALSATFERRGSSLEREPVVFRAEFSQNQEKGLQWRAFLRRMGYDEVSVPFESVIASIKAFVGPVWDAICSEREFFGTWDPNERAWKKWANPMKDE